MTTLPDGYYAVLDPDGPDEPGGDAWTFWRARYGGIRPYPKHARYGPLPPRRLTDGTSRLLGIGPDCRDRIPHELLMAYLAEVKRAQALSRPVHTEPERH
ncbi:hypothetical protein GCM10027447_12660 [Glycomyces halotolerans]